MTLFWRLEDLIVVVAAEQRHADLHISHVGEVNRIPAQPDGEAVARVQILCGIIVLAKVLLNVKNAANFENEQISYALELK